jgi:hypothetical protein
MEKVESVSGTFYETVQTRKEFLCQNLHAGRASHIESISVVSKRNTSRVIHSKIGDSQISGGVDTHELDRRVLEVQASDRRALQAVSVEEFGLGLATVWSFSVPPACSIPIDFMSRRASDRDRSARNRNEWTRPFFVAESGGAFKDNLVNVRKCYALKETWFTSVPELSPVKSRVVPEGTATLERTIVAQEVLDLLASAAPDDPEKVQDSLGDSGN